MSRASDSTRSVDTLLVDNTSIPASPITLDRDGVLASLGYRSDRVKTWEPKTFFDAHETCQRCGKKVYPVEKIDVGLLYHRGCFKCSECGVQLNLRNFQLEQEGGGKKQLYCNVHVPGRHTKGQFGKDALAIRNAMEAQKKASAKGKKIEAGDGWQYDAEALEFQHLKREHPGRERQSQVPPEQEQLGKEHAPGGNAVKRRSLKRRSTLRSWKDFEKFGVFDAQSNLEKIHREEEDELYRQIFDERRQHIREMEREIQTEKEVTVRELVAHWEQKGAKKEERRAGLSKVENYYKNVRKERMRILLQRLGAEEQAAVTRMIEKHSQEMLLLIAEKERQAIETLRRQKTDKMSSSSGGSSSRIAQAQWLDGPEETPPTSNKARRASREEREKRRVSTTKDQQTNPAQAFKPNTPKTSGGQIPNQTLYVTDKGIVVHQTSASPAKGPVQPQAPNHRPAGHPQQTKPPGPRQSNNQQLPPRPEHPPPYQLYADGYAPTGNSKGRGTPQTNSTRTPNSTVTDSASVSRKQATLNASSKETTFGVTTPNSTSKETTFGVTSNNRPVIAVNNNYQVTPNKGYWDDDDDSTGDEEEELSERTQRKPLQQKENQQTQSLVFQKPQQQQKLEQRRLQKQQQRQRQQQQPQKQEQPRKQQPSQTRQDEEEEYSDESCSESEEYSEESTIYDSSFSEASYYPEEMQNKNKRPRDSSRSSDQSDSFEDQIFELSTLSQTPKVIPPKNSKSDLYKTPAVFKVQDTQAIEEAQKEPKSFTDLVRRLSRRCENELQRTRAIFRWVTAKDLNKMRFEEDVNPDSPMALLRGIKYGTESYHSLFKRLCSYAGLHCQVIEGYSKGAGYRPGTPFNDITFRNQWTAVCIEDSWRFINCNWGARHVKGPRDEIMTYKVDEFYFLTDPEQHIHQHFPDQPQWQLLEKPITVEQFVALPVVKSPFFNNKLQFSIPTGAILNVSDGIAEVRLDMPRYVAAAAKVRAKERSVPQEALAERSLARCRKREIIITVNLPCPGSYYLDVYVGGHHEDRMDNACSFQIHCTGVSSDAHVSYPQVGMFGATPTFKQLGMGEHSHRDPLVPCSGDLAVAFSLTKDIRLSHSLQLWNKRDRTLESYDRYALLKLRTPDMAAFLVRCPRRGHYVLSLFGSEGDASSTDMPCVYRCLIECKVPVDDAKPMPKMSKRWKNCKLVEPLTEELAPDTRVQFKIESKLAVEMAIVNNKKWTSLERTGERWQGSVTTGNRSGKLLVCGRFDRGREKFIPLIEYKVKDQVDDIRLETQKLTAYLSFDKL